ncbi:hypothetical protein [Chryseobacterium foetidum]|uniref:hypothetical protein n=1 Tax=Chryseobacterium foetidum TaxID=2951057 RepID=UPI0021C97717|nr:hypothetical protein [Chryseobacterium foetidum]
MKKIVLILTLAGTCTCDAQIIIGDAIGTAETKTSVLLEFAAGENKGIILPYVRFVPQSPTEGTLLLDASNPTAVRVKIYNANNSFGTNGWLDLSGQAANISDAMTVQPNFSSAPEASSAKTIIGDITSPANGVLILESKTKAMVLPIVADVQDILSPSPGMIVYVNKAGSKRLAVFNGSVWSFWRGDFPTNTSGTTGGI